MTEENDQALVELGAQIRRTRLDRRVTVRKLADSAGISESYVRTLERGINGNTNRPSKPALDLLLAIARNLKVDAGPWLELAGYDAEQADEPTAAVRDEVANCVRLIQDAARQLPDRGPLMVQFALDMLKRSTMEVRMAFAGTITVDAADEPRMTQLALESSKTRVRAVSYQDASWWTSRMGDRYLDQHASCRERNVSMTRIFLIEPEELPALRPTLERHLELGIETYVIDKNLVPNRHWEDLVIYDDAILRTAAALDGDSDQKRALFTEDPIRIEAAIDDFLVLLEIARLTGGGAREILDSMQPRLVGASS